MRVMYIQTLRDTPLNSLPCTPLQQSPPTKSAARGDNSRRRSSEKPKTSVSSNDAAKKDGAMTASSLIRVDDPSLGESAGVDGWRTPCGRVYPLRIRREHDRRAWHS